MQRELTTILRRQKESEERYSTKIADPAEFKDVSPEEERKKMAIYGRFPLQRNVREYVPILPPLAYEIDLMLNDQEQNINLDQVSAKIKVYLETEPKNRNEKAIYGRIQRAQNKIDELKKKGKLEKDYYKELADIIKTDRSGWKLKRKSYIY